MMRLLLIMILLVWTHVNVSAGKTNETYQVYINAPDQSVRANVLTTPAKSNADEDRTYFWYASNRIMETKGGYDGKLLHGDYASFYLNNNLKEKGVFRKGLKHGKWIEWFSNGKIKEITHWRNGLRAGSSTSFNELGEKIKEAHYSDDRLNGRITEYEKEKIVSVKKYRKGKEILPRIKQPRKKEPKQDTISKEGVNTKTPPVHKEKKNIKEKCKALLKWKKDKKSTEPRTQIGKDPKEKSTRNIHFPGKKKKDIATNPETK